jgi:hypothetical protein
MILITSTIIAGTALFWSVVILTIIGFVNPVVGTLMLAAIIVALLAFLLILVENEV